MQVGDLSPTSLMPWMHRIRRATWLPSGHRPARAPAATVRPTPIVLAGAESNWASKVKKSCGLQVSKVSLVQSEPN